MGRLGQLVVLGCEIHHRKLAFAHPLGDHIGHARDDRAAQLLFDILHGIAPTRAHHRGQQAARLGHLDDIGAERTNAHQAKLRIAHGDGLRRAPAHVGVLKKIDIINIGAKWAFVTEWNFDQIDQQRDVGGGQRVPARDEHVEKAAIAGEKGQLPFAHHALRA